MSSKMNKNKIEIHPYATSKEILTAIGNKINRAISTYCFNVWGTCCIIAELELMKTVLSERSAHSVRQSRRVTQ
ncbi:hypothetical protein FACS1894205_1300 [Alphaproteobacteria bacterium]|nr:hypothetical protein FACS1894205_1300 [Alphaproteobacteria bacterium]